MFEIIFLFLSIYVIINLMILDAINIKIIKKHKDDFFDVITFKRYIVKYCFFSWYLLWKTKYLYELFLYFNAKEALKYYKQWNEQNMIKKYQYIIKNIERKIKIKRLKNDKYIYNYYIVFKHKFMYM